MDVYQNVLIHEVTTPLLVSVSKKDQVTTGPLGIMLMGIDGKSK